MVAEMRGRGIHLNTVSYTSLITGCADCKDSERAQALLEEMHKEGLTPDTFTYTALITACTKSNEGDAALEVCVCVEFAVIWKI